VRTEVEFAAAEPDAIAGQIGVGTWDATAEFKDVRVDRDGTTEYVADFSKDAAGWDTEGGSWSVGDGSYRQNRRGYGLSYFGDPEWSNYTVTLKARKSSGGEGFLIVFGRQGSDKYWWNLGGWGNQQHAIEMNQNLVGQAVRGKIESDRWYDVKIELAGNRIRCYLDGKLIHDATSTPPAKFFATAGRDDAAGEIVLKAINTSAEPVAANLRTRGAPRIVPEATLTVLKSENLSDNNSLDRPDDVVPVETRISTAGSEFAHEFPPYSLTVMRLKSERN
jgi:alpha-L-arabinofuranosidase